MVKKLKSIAAGASNDTQLANAVKDSVKTTTDYTRALSSGIVSLNTVLKDLGEKQVVIHQTVKKSFFSRG